MKEEEKNPEDLFGLNAQTAELICLLH